MRLFAEMVEDVRPNEVTFVSLLGMCSHNGLVEEGRRCWRAMTDEYGLEPNLKHYGCMVDMLGRAGLLREAFRLIVGMRTEPSPVIWRTLLGACRIHGDLALGRIAKEKLEQMGCRHSGDYVLLSSIYSCADEWHGAEMIRKSMDHKGVRKEAGCALTWAG
ncbi:uncharacterized protein A4U43_C08F22500 [Asparagus officinalis]|nr:uncharacterized protein A4U43_C08F22500 [Asparagus officinalis]